MNKINRRTAMGVIGSVFGSSLLLGNQQSLIKSDNDVIATGFPIIDQSFNGGLRKGRIYCTLGEKYGSGKALFNESVAYNASKDNSVMIYNSDKHLGTRHARVTYVSDCFNCQSMLSSIKLAAENYDLIVLELPLMNYKETSVFVKNLLIIAEDKQVAFLIQKQTTKHVFGSRVSPICLTYLSDGIWFLKEDKTVSKPLYEGFCLPSFSITILKNRPGINVANSAILDMTADPTLILKERV